MRSYGQYCPIARASEVLGDRWTLLIVRELVVNRASHFNEIERGLPGISRSLLAQRLRQLQHTGVVARQDGAGPRASSYHLTRAGEELREILQGLGAWGVRHAFGEPRPHELDPVLLLWRIRGRIDRDQLPPHRVVVEFRFAGHRPEWMWLVLERRGVSLCLKHPGFDPDLRIAADLAALYQVWLGRTTFRDAERCGSLRLQGDRGLARAFPGWLLLSPIAPVVRAERGRRR